MASTKIPVELSSTPGIVDNSNATAITINSSESVGIGTGSPQNTLHVNGTLRVGPYYAVSDRDHFLVTPGGSVTTVSTPNENANYDNSAGNIHIRTNSGYATPVERLTVTSAGNVGIGTTSPSQPLHVEGNVRIADAGSIQFGSSFYQTITGQSGSNDLLYRTYQNHIFKTGTGPSSNTDGTERMRITDGGDVSVGSDHGGFSGWRVLNLRGQSTGALLNYEKDDGTRRAAIANSGSELRLQTFLSGGAITFESGTGTEYVRITGDGNLKFTGKTTNFEAPGFTYHTNNYLYLRGGSAGTIISDDSGINTVQIIDGSSGFINFETGDGTSRMRIKHDGKVGIGTINPHSKLHLVETASGAAGVDFPLTISSDRYQADYGVGIAFRPENQSTGYKVKTALLASGGGYGYNQADLHFCLNTSNTVTDEVSLSDAKMTIKKSGNVGIGTTSPSTPLHVATSGSAIAQFERTGSAAYQLTVTDGGDGAAQLYFQAQTNDTGYNFQTKNSSGTAVDTLFMDPDGNVGIGTTSPTQAFEVRPNDDYQAVIGRARIGDLGYDDFAGFGHYDTGTNYAILQYHTGQTFINASSGQPINFRINNATKMVVASSGNVGIGTTNPTAPLHVLKSDNDVTLLHLSHSSANSGTGDYGHYGEILIQGSTHCKSGIRAYSNGYQTANSALAFFTSQHGGSYAERMRIAGNGFVQIGTTTAGGVFTVTNAMSTNDTLIQLNDAGGTGNHTQIEFRNTNGQVGTINTNGSATSYNTSSDYRLKENVDYTWDATTRLKQLKPARFNFIADGDSNILDGFLAHEVQSVVPEAITGEKDGAEMQGIDQSKLVPLLVKTIQELEARIETLENK